MVDAVLAAMDAAPPGVTIEIIPVSPRHLAPGSLIQDPGDVALGLFDTAGPCRYCGSDDWCGCGAR